MTGWFVTGLLMCVGAVAVMAAAPKEVLGIVETGGLVLVMVAGAWICASEVKRL